MAAGQSQDYESAKNEAISNIASDPDCSALASTNLIRMSNQFKPLLLPSPSPSLAFRFGVEGCNITFFKVLNTVIRNGGAAFEFAHAWQIGSGYLLVQDLIFFATDEGLAANQPAGAPIARRLITVVSKNFENPGFERMKCNLVIQDDRLSMVKSDVHSSLPDHRITFYDQVTGLKDIPKESIQNILQSKESVSKDGTNEKSSEHSMTFDSSASGHSEPVTPDGDGKGCSDWLMDFNDPPLYIPTLKVEKELEDKAEKALTAKKWKSEKVMKHREAVLHSREVDLEEREQDLADRIATVEARESQLDISERNVQASWTRYGTFYFATQKLKAELKEMESSIQQRERDIAIREIPIIEMEEKAKAKAVAELKERICAAESLEESIAIRKEELKERQETLEGLEQMDVINRNALKADGDDITRRLEEAKEWEIKAKHTEAIREAVQAVFRTDQGVLTAREAVVRANEDNTKARLAAVKAMEAEVEGGRLTLGNSKALCKLATNRLKQREQRLKLQMTDRELAVLEREQRVKTLEATVKLERKLIQTHFAGIEEAKTLASKGN
ncbi:hypothetical protein NHQ30_004483 [Ciborinia camelliae]|nr:hypothetical protein NHQ30_004483 [Ciborinia camelliae]